jgi:hypothetical protein
MTEHYTPETLEKGARALWDSQTRQPWQQVGDDEWPSWVDLAARDRLRERARAVLDATAGDIAARALEEAADTWQTGEWANAPRHANRVADRLGAAQHVSDWLRARAARLREGGDRG